MGGVGRNGERASNHPGGAQDGGLLAALMGGWVRIAF